MFAFSRVLTSAVTVFLIAVASAEDAKSVKEVALDASNGVKIKVRMEGPYTAEVPLQVVCYFPYSTEAAKRMSGAPLNSIDGWAVSSLPFANGENSRATNKRRS